MRPRTEWGATIAARHGATEKTTRIIAWPTMTVCGVPRTAAMAGSPPPRQGVTQPMDESPSNGAGLSGAASTGAASVDASRAAADSLTPTPGSVASAAPSEEAL